MAASNGAVEILKQHIAYGTDINGTFSIEGVPGTGGSPLHIACLTAQREVIKVLLDNGANIEQKAVYPDPGGGTPLHWAVFVLNPETGETLLKAGANVNSTDKNGARPLDYVVTDFGTGAILDTANLPPKPH